MNQPGTVQLGRKGFWAISLTLFMIAYSVSVMPAIMPAIVSDFNSSIGYIQSILVLFSLVTASFAPTTENLCRFYGRTPVFLLGLMLYGIGIALTALSPAMGMLAVSFSLLTGLAATPLISTPWAIADLAFDGKAEEQANVALIVASSLGGLSGALLGGYLASQFSWRWAFAPALVVLVVVGLLHRSLPRLVTRYQQPIDWVGGLLSFWGLGFILIGISLSAEFGWWQPKRLFTIAGVVIPPFALSIVPTLIAVGIILLGFFIFWQRRQADRRMASLLRAGLLRKRGFVLGLLTAMLHTLIATGLQFNLFQFVPVALSLNPFQTALTIIPYNITMIIVVIVILKYLMLGDRIPPKYIVHTGIVLIAIGIGLLYRSLQAQITSLDLMPGLIVMGIGSGLFLSYISKLTYSAATADEKPEGSGIYNPVQNLGSSLGRAILGTALISFASRNIVDGLLEKMGRTLPPVQRNQIIAQLQEMIQTLSRQELEATLSSQLPPSIAPLIRPIGLEAALVGMRTSLLIALLCTGICLVLAATLPKYPAQAFCKLPERASYE
jgi:MFS family permease